MTLNPFANPDDLTLGTFGPLPFQDFRLSPQEQEAHATLWGRSGSGKSKLLQSWFIQRLRRRRGVGMIEPHHDLSFDTLKWLISRGFFENDDAFDRLIYIDWGNGRYVPFNVLADISNPHQTALNVLEAMTRAWPELRDAPLFQTLFLASMMVLIHNRLPITWLYPLLSHQDLRRRLLSTTPDPLVHNVFNSFDRIRDQADAAGSTTRRAFLLSFSPSLRYCLGQSENLLNIREIMDQGKAIIINLGNIGDHESRKLLGCLMTVAFEQAALSRTDLVNPAQRNPFTLLIDEWPEFCAQEDTLARVLSQARKYRLFMALASQNISQVSSERLKGALENCRINVVFGLGRTSAEFQARQLAELDPFLVKDQAHYDEQHPQYMPLSEQLESWVSDIQSLNPRYAYVQAYSRSPAKIKTCPITDRKVAEEELDRVLETYAHRYQRSMAQVNAAASQSDRDASPARSINQPNLSYQSLWQKPSNSQHRAADAELDTIDPSKLIHYERR